jgi:multimeric flavodoxin WrbA
MKDIAVIYHSTTGTTGQLAHAVTEGANAVDQVRAVAYPITGSDIKEGRFVNTAMLDAVSNAHGVIMGSPTYMGGVSAQFKAFADASSPLWSERAWVDKIAAGFTIGGNLNGDQMSSIQYIQTLASQHGMLWASLDVRGGEQCHIVNRLGAQGGLIAHTTDSTVHSDDLGAARYLGERVARLVAQRIIWRWQDGCSQLAS